MMKSQWDCLRENLGEWHGSFTQLSAKGDIVSDTPSVLVLEEYPDPKTIRLVLTRSPVGGTPHEMVRSFAYPGPGYTVPFFETGAFSQGSLQWAPFTQFGAELALTSGDRRLRLVQLFNGTVDGKSQLDSITLIRETRAGKDALPSPPLTVEALIGHWTGTAVTVYPSGADPEQMTTNLTIVQKDENHISQTLSFGSEPHETSPRTIRSEGRIEGNSLWFEQGPSATRVLLLPGGGSVCGPVEIERDRPFILEAGWLITPKHRQRLIRRYNERGEWVSLTLVEEHKQDSR